MHVQAILGHRLDHQLFEFGSAVDRQCAAKPFPGQLESYGHTGFGDARAAHGNAGPRVDKQSLVGLFVQVMHVLTELGLAGVKILGAEVAGPLTGGDWINLFGEAIQDPLYLVTHAFTAWAPRAADAEARVFFFIVQEIAYGCTAHEIYLDVGFRVVELFTCFDPLERQHRNQLCLVLAG